MNWSFLNRQPGAILVGAFSTAVLLLPARYLASLFDYLLESTPIPAAVRHWIQGEFPALLTALAVLVGGWAAGRLHRERAFFCGAIGALIAFMTWFLVEASTAPWLYQEQGILAVSFIRTFGWALVAGFGALAGANNRPQLQSGL
jgi:hypothetical protein